MELCDGTLLEYLRKRGSIPEAEALLLGKQILSGILELHNELGVSHRDLHSGNILMSNGNCKITDFGFSTANPVHSKSAGAIHIRAPEVLNGE